VGKELDKGCLECGEKLTDYTYAIYWGKEKLDKRNDQEEIAGFLCDRCRSKHKIKPVKSRNELEKLERLKELLNDEKN
jgi:hypothetical protein